MLTKKAQTENSMRARSHITLTLVLSMTLGLPVAAYAEDFDTTTVIISGRAEHKIDKVVAASEGSVGGSDLSLRPFLRPGEVLEAVPGLIATQHSGGGKANQYFLRGFNLDHGTDFSATIDDFPVNFLTHGHGQGYLDVSGLIPESVKRVDYRKGAYRADAGDFAFTGQANITTKEEDQTYITTEFGEYGYQRLVGSTTQNLGVGKLYVIGQYKHQDGPWTVSEDFNGLSTLTKYSQDTNYGRFNISLSTYGADWIPTDQIPARAVGNQLSSPYGSLDDKLTGHTEREVLTVGTFGDDWRITGWVQHYDFNLFSNFTYYLEDQDNGDEIRQYMTMWAYGGRAEKSFVFSEKLKLTTGAQVRYDDISQVGLDHAVAGVADSIVSRFAVKEGSFSLYAEAKYALTPRLNLVAGLRNDAYSFETRALGGGAWGQKVSDSILSPKLGLSYKLRPNWALYANWGEGFHSNDARGVTNPTDPVPGLVKGNFKELGTRYETRKFIITSDYWWSQIDSELVYVADAGMVEPNNGAHRHGLEITGFWQPIDWLSFDAVWATNDGRLMGLEDGENAIPGAIKASGELGLTATFDHWNIGARVRHLGERVLIEDESVIGKSSTLVNLRYAYVPHGRFEYGIELLNALDTKAHDIDYFYATRLAGEAVDGVEDVNYHMAEPRQLRFSLKARF